MASTFLRNFTGLPDIKEMLAQPDKKSGQKWFYPMSDAKDIILTVLLVLLTIQIIVLFFLKRLVQNFFAVLKDLKRMRALFMSHSDGENVNTIAPVSTCQNCKFRLTFMNAPFNDDLSFSYRCRLNGSMVSLHHSCKDFQTASSKSDSR